MNFIGSGWGQAILMVFMPVLGIPNLIYQHWGQITSFFSAIGTAIVGFFRGIPGAIRGFFNSAYNFATGAWNGAVSKFNGIKSGIINVFSSIGNAIAAPFRAAFNGIRSLWNSTVGGFGFDIPSWIPGIGGKSFKIPMLANGGILRTAGTVLVGEAGPEFLNLPAGASVTPLDKAARREGDTIINLDVRFDGLVTDPEGVAYQIRKLLNRFDARRA
jgi:Flp pilus assembly pilin Flp